jgi:hypothetical protein
MPLNPTFIDLPSRALYRAAPQQHTSTPQEVRMRTLGIVLLLFLFALSCLAQETKTNDQKPATSKQAAAPAMPMPKPSPEIQKLARIMVGTWNVKMQMEPSPEMGMPNGMKGQGKAVTKLGPGGLSVVSDFSSNSMGPFRGHGVTWWDPNDQQFHTLWCDSMTAMGCETAGNGKFDGDKWVMQYVSKAMPGHPMEIRQTLTPTADGFKFDFDGGPEGGDLKPSMHFVYKKAAAGAAPAKAKPSGE